MLDRRARRAPLLVASLASTLLIPACGGGGNDTPARATPSEPKDAPLDEAKVPTKVGADSAEPPVDPEHGGQDAAAEGVRDPGDGEEAGDAPGAEDGEDAEDDPDAEGDEEAGADPAAAEGGDEDGEDVGGDEAGGEAGDEEADDGGEHGGGKDSADLIKEARTTTTTDERALEALAEAEKAGATPKELARAAKARGDYLYKNPDRAKVFFEWSAEKDEDYAEPVFALAKQKAVTGDIDDVVKLLQKVAERKGGKKLLQQIDFDPTWDIVKDDPDVRALL